MKHQAAVLGRRPDPAPLAAGRRVHRRPVPRGGGPRARRRRARPGRHRRRRGREGAGPVRGRDDARAVPGGRARRRRKAAAAGAHGGLGGRRDRDRRRPAWSRPGWHRRVLAVAFEKQSESNAMWALSITPPFSMPVLAGAGGYFAPHIRVLYPAQRRARAHRRDGRGQGPAQRQPATRTRTCSRATSRWSRCGPPPCSGIRSATTRPARPPTARARWSSGTRRRPGPAAGPSPGSGLPRCGPSRPCSPARTT